MEELVSCICVYTSVRVCIDTTFTTVEGLEEDSKEEEEEMEEEEEEEEEEGDEELLEAQ